MRVSCVLPPSAFVMFIFSSILVLIEYEYFARSAFNCGHLVFVQVLMRDVILATDISRQAEYLCQLRQYLDAADEDAGLDLSETVLRRFVLQIALKCADISNPCRWVFICSIYYLDR